MSQKPNHTAVTINRQAWVEIIADAIESTLRWADEKNGGSFRSDQIAEVVVRAINDAYYNGPPPKTRMDLCDWKHKN
ncbi:MAG: hypothetical protein ABIL58_23495 [Pseudomonadota bacterium]